MSDTAPFVNASEPVVVEHLLVSQDVTHSRLEHCMSCENNILDVIPKCNQCDCSISMLTTLSFKTCPVEKW